MKKQDLFYITETSFPTKSANIINSLKFCDSLSKFFNVFFVTPNNLMQSESIKKNYRIKNNLTFISLGKKNINNFFCRLYFALKVCSNFAFKKNKVFVGRSVISSMFLTILNIENTLELHHKPNSFSKFLFHVVLFLPQKKKLKLILINKSLVSHLKLYEIDYIILDDGADIKVHPKKIYTINSKSCVYIGSFYKGKGIEIIDKLSKIAPKIQFHMYGDIKTLDVKKKFCKNIKFFKHIEYKQIPNILSKYNVALMPYQDRISGRSSNLEISKYISPLKMFDYLSSGKIIIASKLDVYSHILKNDFNSFLLSNKNIQYWKLMIEKIFKNPNSFEKIKRNAVKTAKKFTWDIRAKKYVRFINRVNFLDAN